MGGDLPLTYRSKGKISTQPHTQLCMHILLVIHWIIKPHIWMHNEVWGCAEILPKQVMITIWVLGNPKCLRSVADRFNIKKSIVFCVYRRICGAITNNLFGQYMRYLLIWNWAPLGKMINFGSVAPWNLLDQRSNDPSSDRADHWSDKSLSRVDLINHCLKMDLLERNAIDQKSWSGFSQRNVSLVRKLFIYFFNFNFLWISPFFFLLLLYFF